MLQEFLACSNEKVKCINLYPKTLNFEVKFLSKGGTMATTKQKKVARLVQKELGDIFQKKSRSHFDGKMITVTVVRISPDLLIAKAYLSIYPSQNNEKTLELVKQYSSEIRYELGNRIRHQVRRIPELNFFIDDSLDYIDNIDRLLNKDKNNNNKSD